MILTMNFLRHALVAVGISAISLMATAPPSLAQYLGCGTSSSSGSLSDFGEFLEANDGSCTIGDKVYSNFNAGSWATFPSDTTLNISESGEGLLTHTITLSSSTGFNSIAGSETFYFFNYNIAVDPPSPFYLEKWRPGSTTSLANPDYTVTTVATNPLTEVERDETSGLSPQSNFNPNTTESFFANTIRTLEFSDGPNSITQTLSQVKINGSESVPAPLPILGAAAVFGSVRKLRDFSSLLKSNRLA